MPERQILATSGGMVLDERGRWRLGPLLRHALALSGAKRPKLCFVPTASGDSDTVISLCYGAVAGEEVDASHLSLFTMPNLEHPGAHLLAQDVIWVGGGSVANLLALWRVHGLETAFGEAWEKGVVLGGVSAGSICWNVGGTTDSFGPRLRAVDNGLSLLPYGNGVHYDAEAERRPLLQKLVGAGTLPLSFATDNGVGLHYVGTELVEAVTEREGQMAWRIEADQAGTVAETAIEPRLLA